uniref:Uncharacterized protein n=1 Tax=Glossina morsitans morsitans TaxID=37546 RepID=A0A1B0FDU8_GLOMM
MEKPDLIPRIFKALVNSEKTIEELCEEIHEDVDDVQIGIDHAVDLGILQKIEKIGAAVKLAASTAERTMSPIPAMLIVGAEEVVRRREAEAEAVEKKERDLALRPVVGPALARVRDPDPDPVRDPVRHRDAEDRCSSSV